MFLCVFFLIDNMFIAQKSLLILSLDLNMYINRQPEKAFIPAQTLYLLQSYFYKCNHYHENIKRSVVLRPYLL